MAGKSRDESRDKVAEVMQGLETLIEAGKVDEVEEVLTTLVESEPAEEPSPEEQEMRTYARGVRDGLSLARELPAAASS